jgi:integrase
MPDLSKIGERERLKTKPGDEPHWQRLWAGCFVGFRPSKRQGKGTWFARTFDPETARYARKALGSYGSLTGNEVFAQAKRDAEKWAEQVQTGGVLSQKINTVADACRSYLEERPGQIAEGVFRRHVYHDPIANVKLEKLRRHHLREWRKRLEQCPALLSRNKSGEKRSKIRAASTVNRDMVPLRAALGRVIAPGCPNTEAAWQEALRPNKAADGRRTLYLDKAERRKLLDAAELEAAPLVRALCLLPIRPGALASLKVQDYDQRTATITIGTDKNGTPRQITVPPSVSDFFTNQTKGRNPAAPLFFRECGKSWDKDSWKHPIKRAVAIAKLPNGVSAYTLRHSVITDLVRGGLPVLTVAQLSGTSVAMIERHYGHLVREDAEKALAKLML